MAIDRFIDDISVIAVEICLIKKLPLLLTPNRVLELGAAEIKLLVGESEETAIDRKKLNEKLGLLQKGLQDIKRFKTHRDKQATASQTALQPPSTIEEAEASDEETDSTQATPLEKEAEQEEAPQEVFASSDQYFETSSVKKKKKKLPRPFVFE